MTCSISTLLGGAAAALFLMAPAAFAQEAAVTSEAVQPADSQTFQVVHPATTTAKKTVTGTLTIMATLTTNADLPAGTNITFYGSASAYDNAFTNSHSVSATGKTAGGKVSVTIKIPYTFLVSSTSDTVSVSLNASANASTSGPTYNFSTSFTQTIPLPATGKTTAVKFAGSI